MSVIVLVHFRCKPHFTEAVRELLQSGQPYVIEAGCHAITLSRDQADPHRLVEVEHWETAADHRAFLAAANARGMFDPLAEMLAGPVETLYLDELETTRAPEL